MLSSSEIESEPLVELRTVELSSTETALRLLLLSAESTCLTIGSINVILATESQSFAFS